MNITQIDIIMNIDFDKDKVSSYIGTQMREMVNRAANIEREREAAKKHRLEIERDARAERYKLQKETNVVWCDVPIATSIDDAKVIYGRKWKVVIENFYNLIKFIEEFAGKADVVSGEKMIGKNAVVALPQTCKTLLTLFGTQMNVCKVIKKAVEVGLLMECPHSYSVGYDSKHYWVNVEKVNEVLWLKVTINSDEARKETLSIPNVPYSKTIRDDIRFGSGLRLNAAVTDEDVFESLKANYKSLEYFYELNEVNNKLLAAFENPVSVPNVPYSKTIRELSTKFSPTITRNAKSGNITSIGIRATNRACAIPKSGSAYTRADFFAKLYGTSKVCEFDVKSSIYRVTYFMNTGKWMDNSIDFYEKMCPYTFTDDTDRDNYKQICMRLYFGKSAADVYAKMWRSKLIDKNTRNEEFVRQMYNNMRKVVRHHIRK